MSSKNFQLTTSKITTSGRVQRDKNCYGFIFWNKGGSNVLVDDKLLKAYPPGQPELSGESWSYVDMEQREYTTPYFTVTFLNNVDPYLEITQVVKSMDNG